MSSHSDDLELEFPEPGYFKWQVTYRHEDPNDFSVEFSQGTLSPLQNTVLLLHRAAETSGGYVKLLQSCQYCPVLFGNDGKTVPLYKFVEVIDEVIDYDKVKEELPNLSYAQIHGSLMFLRKVAQFNVRDYDIDEMENEELANDPAFLDELRRALADQETTRVLNFDQHDNG